MVSEFRYLKYWYSAEVLKMIHKVVFILGVAIAYSEFSELLFNSSDSGFKENIRTAMFLWIINQEISA